MWGLMGGAGGPDTAVGTSEGEKRPRWKLRLRPCRLRLRHKRHASVGHCSGRGDREGPPWSLAVLWVKRVLVATEKGHLICTPEGDVLTLAPPPPAGTPVSGRGSLGAQTIRNPHDLLPSCALAKIIMELSVRGHDTTGCNRRVHRENRTLLKKKRPAHRACTWRPPNPARLGPVLPGGPQPLTPGPPSSRPSLLYAPLKTPGI